MKKLLCILLALAALGAPALATLAGDEALGIAAQYVPPDAVHQRTDTDDDSIEVRYLSADGSERYTVEIDAETGGVTEFTRRILAPGANATVPLDDGGLLDAIAEMYPGAQITASYSERDDGRNVLNVFFATDELYGCLEADGDTGEILEIEVHFDGPGFTGRLTRAEVGEALNALKPGAVILEIELDREDGRLIYEGDALHGGIIYEFEMDAATGELIEWERD